jgi:hypothetical protein
VQGPRVPAWLCCPPPLRFLLWLRKLLAASAAVMRRLEHVGPLQGLGCLLSARPMEMWFSHSFSLTLSLSLCHPGHGNGSFGGHSLSNRWCILPIDAVACMIEGAKLAAISIKDYKFSYLNAISD